MKKFLMMSVVVAAFFIGQLAFSSPAQAQDVYVGTSDATGRDCYVMTETIRRYTSARYHIDVRLKMVRRSDNNVQYLDYTFTDGGGSRPGFWFQNSQGFSAMVDKYETPIEWKMLQVIK